MAHHFAKQGTLKRVPSGRQTGQVALFDDVCFYATISGCAVVDFYDTPQMANQPISKMTQEFSPK
jgi:hypothetical protein